MAYQLIIGNKNYSSWSLRPWLLMKHSGLLFEERRLVLRSADFKSGVLKYTPAGKVPVLVHGDTHVWDSLAICEYLAERHPKLHLWPEEPAERALARSICAEMHSGFMDLRTHMPMNCRKNFPGKGNTPEVQRDIARINAIWEDCRERHINQGPFLFGHFTIADAFYAPVALRFRTYAVELSDTAQAYTDTIFGLPAMQLWLTAARSETETIPQFEPYS